MTHFPTHGPWFATCALFVVLLCSALAARSAPLVIDGDSRIHPLAGYTTQLHDPQASFDLDEVRQQAARGDFRPMPGGRSNFGYVDGALWFRFEVRNVESVRRDWLLAIEYALLDHVSLFAEDSEGQPYERHSGDRTAFATRDAELRHLNFRIDLPPGETREIFLRVASQSSMQVPLVLARSDAYLISLLPEQIGLGLYYGVLLALLLYNLILWISTRDRNFLWYVLYVAALGLLLLCLNGFAFQYLWPRAPDWGNWSVPISIAAANLLMLQFSRSFLELHRHAPRADRWVLGFMLLAALPLIATFVLPYRPVVQAQTVLALLIAPLIVVCAVSCLKTYPPARHFLIAWSTLLVGVMTYAAVSLGLLPKNPLTEYSMQLGSAAEMVLLSFALAYRINLLKSENERIQNEARELLEARVQARTAELDAAMGRLEDANRRLHDFSRRDGLTGVYNRRHLDDVVMHACTQARDRAQALSLLMVDVDHFKQINDVHGHVVGDDCLRGLALLLDREVRAAGGTLARFGGEEFAAVLPNTGLNAARELGERIRREVAARPIQAEGRPVEITVSLGLYAVPGGYPCSAAELLRHADAALYRAKRGGRNRIEITPLA